MLSCNQVDGFHQQIIIKVLVDIQQKMETDFTKGKGKNQSGNVENEIFKHFCIFIIDLDVVGRK